MLQSIRDNIQGWIAGVIIVLIAGAFVLWGLQSYLQSGQVEKRQAVVVNGQPISKQALESHYRQLRRWQRSQHKDKKLSAAQLQRLKSYALNQLVQGSVLMQLAATSGFRASTAQIKQMIADTPAFQVNGAFSKQRFVQILAASGLTPQQYIGQLRQKLLIGQLLGGVAVSNFVLPSELDKFYGLTNQKRSFGYFNLPLSHYRHTVKVSAKQIKAYYDQHKAKFKTPDKVKVHYIELSPKQLSKSIQVSQQQLKNYYQAHAMNFSRPARWHVEQIVVPLAANANSAAVKKAMAIAKQWEKSIKAKIITFKSVLAKAKKAGYQTSKQWVSEKDIHPPLRQQLENLEIKGVSAPFRTREGVAIVQLLALQTPEKQSFSKVKAKVEKAVKSQRLEQLLASKTEQLSDLVYTHPSSLEPAAKALGLKVKTSQAITRHGEKQGLFSHPEVLRLVYSDDVLKQGNNSQPLALKNGNLLVVRIAKHFPGHEKPLAELKSGIEKRLRAESAANKAGYDAYQIQSALNKGESPAALAKRYGFTWHKVHGVSVKHHKKHGVPMQALRLAFKTLPSQKDKPVAVTTLIDNKAYIVLMVSKVTDADAGSASKQSRQKLSAALLRIWEQIDAELLIKSAVGSAKVVYPKSK